MRDFLLQNIHTSLDICGVSLAKYGEKAVYACDYLLDNQAKSLTQNAEWIDHFAQIPDNIVGLSALFKSHGYNAHDAATAALANPQIFVQSHLDTASRVEEAKTRLACPSLGMKREEIFPLYADKPRLFSYTPSTIEEIFKLTTLFLESPFVAFRDGGHGSDFRPYRVNVVKSQFGSVSNALLRMTAAELSFLSPSRFAVRGGNYYGSYYVDTAHSFHRTARGGLEKEIVRALGFKGPGVHLDAPDGLLTPAERKEQTEKLKAKRDDFVRASLECFDRDSAPTAPREWKIRVLSFLNDDGDNEVPSAPEDTRKLRANMALAGLLRSYRLAP